MNVHRPLRLARYLALAWMLLLIYGSLHPFSGWRDNGLASLAFLGTPWPRYWTGFDLTVNVLAYLPLGALLTLGFWRLPGRATAAVLAVLIGTTLSFTMEWIQNWLPSRVPSNLDLACNGVGTLMGALVASLTGPRTLPHLGRWLQTALGPLPNAELGLTLVGIWLFIPLSPEILLFGAGDLRQILGLPSALPFSAEHFARAEAAVVAANVLAIGLLVRMLASNLRIAHVLASAVLAIGLLVRTLSAAVLVGPASWSAWLTPGVAQGLIAGIALLLPAMWLPARGRLALGALALMTGTVLVNLAPANPYSPLALVVWTQGHFLNFNGLTRLVSIVWPFLALPYLMVSGRRE